MLVQQSSGYVILIPGHIINDHAQMLHLLNVTCGREDLLYTGMVHRGLSQINK